MHRRIPSLLLILLATAATAFGQSDWSLLAPTGSGMSALLPGTPKGEIETKPGYTGHTYTLTAGRIVYVVNWTVYTDRLNIEGELDADRDNFVKALTGKLLSDTRITQNGIAGREFTGENANGFFVSRVFASGSRVWMIATLELTGSDDTRSVMKALTSLTVTASP